jgi:predicted O-methyltransferase YrrM
MNRVYQAPDWADYRMSYQDPHAEVEPLEQEISVVNDCLNTLVEAGIIPAIEYDQFRFTEFRRTVAERFEIPWTAITPRMQRLLWALNAIRRPERMIAAGVFCGNTFISNAGAAVGPGAVYQAADLVGIEIKPEEAERAERNVRAIDETGVAHIVAADAVDFCRDYDGPIDLLYLDADGDKGRGKGIYLEILEASYDKLTDGALVLAHNSINSAEKLEHYLAYVRDSAHMRASVNCFVDGEGLEVSVK